MKKLLVILLWCSATSQGFAFPQYRVHDIGVRDYPTESLRFDLSESGFALMSKSVPGTSSIFSLAGGTQIIPHPTPLYYGPSWVGENGDTAGAISTNQFIGTAAYRTRDGVITEYERFLDVSSDEIVDRNSSGISAGQANWFNSFSAPIYWTPDGQVHELQNFGESDQFVSAISDNGRIVGNRGFVPVYWDLNEQGSSRRIFQTSSANFHTSMDVNSHNITVGAAAFPGRFELMLWNSAGSIIAMTNTEYGFNPFSINDENIVVGAKWQSPNVVRGALWTQDGGFVDVNTLLDPASSTYQIITLEQINNRGEVVGLALKDGIYRGVFLEPVPEPGTMAVLGLGVMWLMRKRRAR